MAGEDKDSLSYEGDGRCGMRDTGCEMLDAGYWCWLLISAYRNEASNQSSMVNEFLLREDAFPYPASSIQHLASRISNLASRIPHPATRSARGILTHNSTQSVIFVHMHVTDEMIENLASLSRLRFNDEEKNEIRKDLQRMISFVEKLNEVDTTGVEPLLHMTDAINVYREDQVSGSMPKEEALKNAPAADKNYFKVPKVIKK